MFGKNRGVAHFNRRDETAAIAAYEESLALWKKLADKERERQEDVDYVEKKLAELRQGK